MFTRLTSTRSVRWGLRGAVAWLLCTGVALGCDDRPQLSVEPDVSFSPDAEPDAEPDSVSDAGALTDGGSMSIDGGVVAADGGFPDAGPNVPQPSEACATYLACLTAIDPTIVDDELLGAFGPGGTCWVNGPNISDFCDVQCRAELGNAQEFADLFPECFFADAIPPDPPDAGPDAAPDAGGPDAGPLDAGPLDAGAADGGALGPDAGMDAGTNAADAGNLERDAGISVDDAGNFASDAGVQSADGGA
jgi:hypothetical protein